jgi:hypothetical protein
MPFFEAVLDFFGAWHVRFLVVALLFPLAILLGREGGREGGREERGEKRVSIRS